MTNEYKDEWRKLIQCDFHPACDALPDLSEEDFQKLVADIKENGIREPVVFWQEGRDNKEGRCLVSGRHRYRANEAAGMRHYQVPQRTVYGGKPLDWVVSLDVRRRHLTKEEQADIIIRLAEADYQATKATTRNIFAELEAELAKPKLDDSQPVSEPVTHKGGRGKTNPVRQAAVVAGKAAGISESTVKTALRKREAENQGKPAPKRDRKAKPKTKAEPEVPGLWLLRAVDSVVTGCDALKLEKLAQAPHPHRGQALDELRECNAKIEAVIKKLELLEKADRAAIAKASGDNGNGHKPKAKGNGKHVTA
jgi:hypothetical protein